MGFVLNFSSIRYDSHIITTSNGSTVLWIFIARNYNWASVYRSKIVSFKKEFVARTNFFYAERFDGQWKFINRALPCLFGDFIENRSVIYIIVNSLRGFRRNHQKSKVNRSVSRSNCCFWLGIVLFRIKYQKFIARKNRASVYRSQIVSFWKEFVARTNFFYAEWLTGNENSLTGIIIGQAFIDRK